MLKINVLCTCLNNLTYKNKMSITFKIILIRTYEIRGEVAIDTLTTGPASVENDQRIMEQ